MDNKSWLITRNLQEVMGGDQSVSAMETIMMIRPLHIYWGTATTGVPHIGYFVPMAKIADFLRAGCKVTILLADLHAHLDSMKTPIDLLTHRINFYREIILMMLDTIGVDSAKLSFVVGSTFQLSTPYTLDMYRLATMTTYRNATKAGADVVKESSNPTLGPMLYPLLQALDIH